MIPVQPQHIAALAAVVRRTIDESGNPEGFDVRTWTAHWLQASLPALGGSRPAEYMGTREGRLLVANVDPANAVRCLQLIDARNRINTAVDGFMIELDSFIRCTTRR